MCPRLTPMRDVVSGGTCRHQGHSARRLMPFILANVANDAPEFDNSSDSGTHIHRHAVDREPADKSLKGPRRAARVPERPDLAPHRLLGALSPRGLRHGRTWLATTGTDTFEPWPAESERCATAGAFARAPYETLQRAGVAMSQAALVMHQYREPTGLPAIAGVQNFCPLIQRAVDARGDADELLCRGCQRRSGQSAPRRGPPGLLAEPACAFRLCPSCVSSVLRRGRRRAARTSRQGKRPCSASATDDGGVEVPA